MKKTGAGIAQAMRNAQEKLLRRTLSNISFPT